MLVFLMPAEVSRSFIKSAVRPAVTRHWVLESMAMGLGPSFLLRTLPRGLRADRLYTRCQDDPINVQFAQPLAGC